MKTIELNALMCILTISKDLKEVKENCEFFGFDFYKLNENVLSEMLNK